MEIGIEYSGCAQKQSSLMVNRLVKLKEDFRKLAKSMGFEVGTPADLLIEDDTLLFANSTISGFKQELQQGTLPSNGYHISQNCIRNQNFRAIRDQSTQLQYMSCFTQMGLLGDKNSLEKITEFAWIFLNQARNIPAQRILFKTSKQLRFFDVGKLESWGVAFEQDKQPPSYYQWQYGIKGIFGQGLTIAIYNGVSNTFEDIGNIIEISNEQGVIGYEFGFGLETYIAREKELASPFEAAVPLPFLVDIEPLMRDKLLDSMMISAILCALDIVEGSGKRASIYKRALNDMCYLAVLSDVSISTLIEAAREYVRYMQLPELNIARKLQSKYQSIIDKISKACDYFDYALHWKMDYMVVEQYCVQKLGIASQYIQPMWQQYDRHHDMFASHVQVGSVSQTKVKVQSVLEQG